MNKTLLFVLGCLTGIIVTLTFLLVIALVMPRERDSYPNNDKPLTSQEDNIQYFTVTHKNKDILLHTEMSQDSVRLLMGKPDDKSYHTNAWGEIEEIWKYNTRQLYVTLDFTFKDGNLKEVSKL